ncbi:hypothetical protein HNP36_003786 [Chryseobacterium shigense]|uniref:Uncharacterized protein n=1 Tax=Chryseobacterium shigense TaxID=297244 RepID=A0A841NFP1_9FLAO|nr:hypothetical protein [Chryseobacterium shigense]
MYIHYIFKPYTKLFTDNEKFEKTYAAFIIKRSKNKVFD